MIVSYILNKGAELLGKKWRAVIIWHLRDGPLRFSQIKKRIPDISVKVLSEVLQEMEVNDLVVRTQYNTIPVKVTYQMHEDAESIVKYNVEVTVAIAEYLVKNPEKNGTSADTVDAINKFIISYRKQETK